MAGRMRSVAGVDGDAHRAGKAAADRMLVPAEFHEQRAAEGLVVADLEAVTRGDPAAGQIAEHLGVGVRYAHEDPAVAGVEALHALGRGLVELEVGAWDRIAVGVHRRVAELGRDQLLELVGEDVLEHLGLGVNAIPGHAERIGEEALEEAVVADHLERHAPPGGGQAHPAVGLVRDEAQLVELLEHRRHRAGCDAETLCECAGRDRLLAPRLQREDRLRVVVDRGRAERFGHPDEMLWHTKNLIKAGLSFDGGPCRELACQPMAPPHQHGGHRHDHAGDSRRLATALSLILAFMAAEVACGVIAHSLALLSDAAHMLTDAAALGLSLVAARLARRPAGGSMTYGLGRVEVLAAQANGVTLLVLAAFVIYEAISRLVAPPHVQGGLMLAIALVGVAVNLAAALTLSGSPSRSLNVEGSFRHILTDLYAFIGTAAAAAVILASGFERADPIASLIVAALMLKSAFWLLRASARVFLEAAPEGFDVESIGHALAERPGIVEIHDLHV